MDESKTNRLKALREKPQDQLTDNERTELKDLEGEEANYNASQDPNARR